MEQLLGPNPYANQPVPSLVTPQPGKCNYKCVRKEFHKVDKNTRHKYLWGLRKLMEKTGNNMSPWEIMSKEHFDYARLNHNTKSFFPFHRLFLARLEATLQSLDPSLCLLYWDWSYESQDWKKSEIWNTDMLGMGGNGITECINGPFSDIKLSTVTHPSGCISRGFGESVFFGTSFLSEAHNKFDNYKEWVEYWESNPHAVVHRYIGGDMVTQYSSSDPVFYFHLGILFSSWCCRLLLLAFSNQISFFR